MEFNSLGNNIKKYRNKIGLTQKDLAEKILKSEISVRKYESGKINIPPSTLFELCNIFNIKLRTLLGNDMELYIENNPNYEKDLLKIISSQDIEVINNQANAMSNLLSTTQKIFKYGTSWRDRYLKTTSTPEGLLYAILSYLQENDLYYTATKFSKENKTKSINLNYFKKTQIKDIIEKVSNLVLDEIDKIEYFNNSVHKKTLKITKYFLENNNIEFNKKEFEELYNELEDVD